MIPCWMNVMSFIMRLIRDWTWDLATSIWLWAVVNLKAIRLDSVDSVTVPRRISAIPAMRVRDWGRWLNCKLESACRCAAWLPIVTHLQVELVSKPIPGAWNLINFYIIVDCLVNLKEKTGQNRFLVKFDGGKISEAILLGFHKQWRRDA